MMSRPVRIPAQFEAYLARPEIRILTACCRVVLGVAGDEELDAALALPFDEAALESACEDHRLSVLVNRVLVRRRPDRFSPAFRERRDRFTAEFGQQHLRMCKAVVDIHKQLQAAGLRHVFLKGPVLGRFLFGGELLRYYGDLDVLTDPRDFPAVHEALSRLGYRAYRQWWQRLFGLPLKFTHHKDTAYIHPSFGIYLELHWMLDEVKPFPNGFDWASPVIGAREFHGQRVPVFPAANDFVYLCFHAAKHHWERFQWLLDIAAWMRRPEFDPEDVVALAGREGFGPVVMEGLWMAHAVLGVKPLMSRPVDPGEGARAARRFVVQHFGSPALRPLFRTWYGTVLYPRLSQRLRFWLDRLTEWAFVKIPRLHPTADEGGRGT